MSDAEVQAEFLRRTGLCDHPYARTPEPCCNRPSSRHLGYAGIPWTLPPIEEMRSLLALERAARRG